jgi:hypothetical protein
MVGEMVARGKEEVPRWSLKAATRAFAIHCPLELAKNWSAFAKNWSAFAKQPTGTPLWILYYRFVYMVIFLIYKLWVTLPNLVPHGVTWRSSLWDVASPCRLTNMAGWVNALHAIGKVFNSFPTPLMKLRSQMGFPKSICASKVSALVIHFTRIWLLLSNLRPIWSTVN